MSYIIEFRKPLLNLLNRPVVIAEVWDKYDLEKYDGFANSKPITSYRGRYELNFVTGVIFPLGLRPVSWGDHGSDVEAAIREEWLKKKGVKK